MSTRLSAALKSMLASVQDCDFHQSLELYRFVSAMALLCCGSIYFMGGILCFGLLKRSELQQSCHSCLPQLLCCSLCMLSVACSSIAHIGTCEFQGP